MAGDFGFLKGNIETIILNALHSGDKYGYEIAKEIKERTENQYEIKQPTLYSYLKRLESNNLITSYWGAESNGGRRRYYKLTQQGREDCEKFSAEWKYHKSVMDNLVDVDGSLPDLTQDEVTPLFGTKTKRARKGKGVSVNDYDEQELIARKLAEINKAKQNQETVFTVDAVNSEQNVTEQVVISENSGINAEEKTDTVEAVDVNTDVAKEVVSVAETNLQENSEFVEKQTSDTTLSETIQTTTVEIKEEPKSENLNQQQQQDVNARFEVHQDDADAFMAKLDERINAMSQHRNDSKDDDDIDYQNVLLNVMGKQLNDMESYNNSNPDDRYVYATERPLALEDVADEFAKEGIRMRIYNRTTAVYRPKKLLPLNKIFCQTAWISYAIFAVLLSVLMLATRTYSNWIPYAIVAAVLIVAPLVFTFYFMSDPSRKNQPVFNFKFLLIVCAVVAVLVCMFAFGINILLFDLKFSNISQVSTQVGIPTILGLCPLIVVVVLKANMAHYSK